MTDQTPTPADTPDPNPVTTHIFNYIGGTGDRPDLTGTDHFRCDYCDRDFFESGIRDENGVFRRGTVTERGPAANEPCERAHRLGTSTADTTR